MPDKKQKTTTALKTKKSPGDGSAKQNNKKDEIIPANVDTSGASERVRANAGGGLNEEGTNVNYEEERRNG